MKHWNSNPAFSEWTRSRKTAKPQSTDPRVFVRLKDRCEADTAIETTGATDRLIARRRAAFARDVMPHLRR